MLDTLCEFVSDENDIDYEQNISDARNFVMQNEQKIYEVRTLKTVICSCG